MRQRLMANSSVLIIMKCRLIIINKLVRGKNEWIFIRYIWNLLLSKYYNWISDMQEKYEKVMNKQIKKALCISAKGLICLDDTDYFIRIIFLDVVYFPNLVL